jgi:hypothetical protein
LVTASVHDGNEEDPIGIRAIEDSIWEAFNKNTTEVSILNGERSGRSRDSLHGRVQSRTIYEA